MNVDESGVTNELASATRPTAEERYKPVNLTWSERALPPVTREEAERAAKKIAARFGGMQHGGPGMVRPYQVRRVRVCWITRTGATTHKGWPRLVHDLSHMIFRARHPGWPPHHPAHARLEREITEFVVASGWLAGSLRTVEAKPTREARAAGKRERLVERLAAWEAKLRRATNAARKVRRQLAALDRRAARVVDVVTT